MAEKDLNKAVLDLLYQIKNQISEFEREILIMQSKVDVLRLYKYDLEDVVKLAKTKAD